MPVQTVPFVPIFILGGFFLIAPGMVVTLFTNSDPLGFAVVMATAIAALVRPTASWTRLADVEADLGALRLPWVRSGSQPVEAGYEDVIGVQARNLPWHGGTRSRRVPRRSRRTWRFLHLCRSGK